MDIQTFFGKGPPHLLLWAGSQAARGKITLSCIPDRLNYCVNILVDTQFTNVAAVRKIQPGEPFAAQSTQVADP